jgi:hypothetical protein
VKPKNYINVKWPCLSQTFSRFLSLLLQVLDPVRQNTSWIHPLFGVYDGVILNDGVALCGIVETLGALGLLQKTPKSRSKLSDAFSLWAVCYRMGWGMLCRA